MGQKDIIIQMLYTVKKIKLNATFLLIELDIIVKSWTK